MLAVFAMITQALGQFSPDCFRVDSHPRSVREASHYAAHSELQRAAYNIQSDSDNSPDDLEEFTKWKFKWHLYFAAGKRTAGTTNEDTFREGVEEQYLTNLLSLSRIWHCFAIPRPKPTSQCNYHTQSKTDPKDTDRLLLIQGKVQREIERKRKSE